MKLLTITKPQRLPPLPSSDKAVPSDAAARSQALPEKGIPLPSADGSKEATHSGASAPILELEPVQKKGKGADPLGEAIRRLEMQTAPGEFPKELSARSHSEKSVSHQANGAASAASGEEKIKGAAEEPLTPMSTVSVPPKPLSPEVSELLQLKSLLTRQSNRFESISSRTPEVDVSGVLQLEARVKEPENEEEEIDEDDVEAVVRSIPSPPSLEVKDGGRYFLHQLARGEVFMKRAANGKSGPSKTTSSRDEESEREVQELYEKLEEQQNRMSQRFAALKQSWCQPPDTTSTIVPEPPSVFSAETEDEVREKAAAAEDFVKNHTNRIRRQKIQNRNKKKSAVGSSRRTSVVSFEDSLDQSTLSTSELLNDSITTAATGVSGGLTNAALSSVDPPAEAGEEAGKAFEVPDVTVDAETRALEAARAIMDMLENRADVILPSPADTNGFRLGDVLPSSHLLKLDLQEALQGRVGPTGPIAGAPYFRIAPKFNIAGVAQPTIIAVKTILNELRRAHIESPIIWVNLREEPVIYINNDAYVVRECSRPSEPIIIPNATGRSIEVVEAKLKSEIIAESGLSAGNISVYLESNSGTMENQWISATAQNVLTLQEVFSHISRSTYGRSQLQYYRWPLTQNIGPQPEHFDFVLEACLEEPKGVFIFNCQSGRGKTSGMMQIANIVRFYQLCVKDVAVDGRLLRSAAHGPKLKTIQKLISLLPDGKLHQRRIFTLMGLADSMYSMIDHINDSFENQDQDPNEAMMRLQLYAYFIVFSYYCEQRLWNFQTKESFAGWLATNSEIMRLIAGIREKLTDQIKEERIGDVGENVDVKTLQLIRHRAGNVLGSGRILCSMEMPPDGMPKDLRQLGPGVPMFTCGRMTPSTPYSLLTAIKHAFPEYGTVYWLSVRAEPHVFINGRQFVLSEFSADSWTSEVGTSMHVSLKAMEQMEERLRRDVLLEAQENKGHVLVHHITASGERVPTWIKVVNVKTPKSVMDEFAFRSGATYNRVPVPFVNHMLGSDLDPLLKYLSEKECDKSDIYVINDYDGGTRVSVALNVVTLYRASRFVELRSLQTPRDVLQQLSVQKTDQHVPIAQMSMDRHVSSCKTVPDKRVEVLLASTICQMLTGGSLLRTLDAVVELGGVGKEWNVLHYVDFLKSQIYVLGNNKPQCILEALHGLRTYLHVLLVALYLDSNGDFTNELPFSAWVHERKEVYNIIKRLDARGEHALKYVNAENLMKADVSRRAGDVLTANFCLKADHFPGCQKKGLRPALCGAPNFRKVRLVNVYGVAIATLIGIHNILSLLGASDEPLRTYPGQKNDPELYLGFAAPRLFDPAFKPEELQRPLRGSCLWINLREEPILYVGDRPFVFRDLAAPYVNVELTGIETSKIEHVESQLKLDVLNEADLYQKKFLVHDEATPGELVGIWEDATEESVKTTREVYNEVVDKGYRCLMLRLPVTDEQSPEIRDFDLLLNALLPSIAEHMDRRETLSFVFNCQMGRGRTTTGMVICCLLIGLVIPEYFTELKNQYNPLFKETDSQLSQGNYTIVNQLKRVLINGRKAKERVDLVLEACDKMQNLRTAIEGFVIAVQSPDFTEEQRARSHHAGIHYLVRYFNLIVFAVYLEEEYNRMQKRMNITFEEWMGAHPEIITIAQSAALQ